MSGRIYSRGDVAEVEGRLAVYMVGKDTKRIGRWEWMDGTWTTIPLHTPTVLLNIYDEVQALSEYVGETVSTRVSSPGDQP